MGRGNFNLNAPPSVASRTTSNSSAPQSPQALYTAPQHFYVEITPPFSLCKSPVSDQTNGCLEKSLNGLRESTSTLAPVAPVFATPATSPIKPARGPSKTVASLPEVARLAALAPLPAKKKALLIGLNYRRCGNPGRELKYATRDAHRFAATLSKLGYATQDMDIVTDEPNQPFPSQEYLLKRMDRLLEGASKGDQLFFMFSGHCDPAGVGKPEEHFVAADLKPIPRSVFQDRLISKVPTGVEMTIVLDCCNAAGMAKLPHCIGRMEYEREVKKSNGPAETGKPIGLPQAGSLQGLPITKQKVAPLPPASADQFPFSPVSSPPQRRSHGIAAAQPLLAAVPDREQAPGIFPSFAGKVAKLAPTPAPAKAATSAYVRVGRQLVVEGRPLRYFQERKKGFVAPAGKVLVWAGTGIRSKSFESSTGVKNGIVTDAICSVFDQCVDKPVTYRDVWHSLVAAIDKENTLRTRRDAGKQNLATNIRWQCAEAWASQGEHLSSSSPILEKPVCWIPVA